MNKKSAKTEKAKPKPGWSYECLFVCGVSMGTIRRTKMDNGAGKFVRRWLWKLNGRDSLVQNAPTKMIAMELLERAARQKILEMAAESVGFSNESAPYIHP